MASQQPNFIDQWTEIGEQISRFKNQQEQILAALKSALDGCLDDINERPDGACENLGTITRSGPPEYLEPINSPGDNVELRSRSSTEKLDEVKEILDQQFGTLDKVLTDEFHDIESRGKKLDEDLDRRFEALDKRLDNIDEHFAEIKDLLRAVTNTSVDANGLQLPTKTSLIYER
ncbi:hypothetical protein O1611_g2861 [Lasiodiplodia mahajangana]|uniref:Uncharacterized protein n=1 Tax=Lasiodiplodia mahajangana TaxID=1108764 RepID=A0ACC2JU23_9PEZI|nr:hypothetical protein O1611_g2861 [Lasiodiplodia mahajangana]